MEDENQVVSPCAKCKWFCMHSRQRFAVLDDGQEMEVRMPAPECTRFPPDHKGRFPPALHTCGEFESKRVVH